MKTNIGIIRKKRGWKVNTIDFDPTKGDKIYWNCPPGVKFWVLLPIGIFASTKNKNRIDLVESENRKAHYTMVIGKLRKGVRGRDHPFSYCLLLDDGEKVQYVHGNTPPKIIIW